MTAIASVLADHVAFQLDSVDRLFVAGYVPQLQHEGGLIRFLLDRGFRIPVPGRARPQPRPAGLRHRSLCRRARHPPRAVRQGGIQGRSVPAVPAEAIQQSREGVVLVGKAQERVAGWRGFKDKSSALHSEAHPHFTYRRQALFVDYWYFYLWDDQWGPGFIKLCPYAPYGVWALPQTATSGPSASSPRPGSVSSPSTNGLRSVEDVSAARRICARLGHGHVQGFLDRWLRRLPSALTASDRRAGYGYRFSIRQLELSHTAVFDRPQSGRAWFEAAIRGAPRPRPPRAGDPSWSTARS